MRCAEGWRRRLRAALADGQQIDLEDIAYINPGSGAVELQGIEGVGTFFGTPFALREINVSAKSRSAASAQARPVLIIKLIGGSYKQCTKGKSRSASSVSVAGGEQQAKRKPVRRLWGKGKGRFRTRGRFSSGTVRGTNWLTQDFCEGTLTRVVEGAVSVYDLVAKKTIAREGRQELLRQGRQDQVSARRERSERPQRAPRA